MKKYYRYKVGDDNYSVRRRNPDGTFDHLYYEDDWFSKQTVNLLNELPSDPRAETDGASTFEGSVDYGDSPEVEQVNEDGSLRF